MGILDEENPGITIRQAGGEGETSTLGGDGIYAYVLIPFILLTCLLISRRGSRGA